MDQIDIHHNIADHIIEYLNGNKSYSKFSDFNGTTRTIIAGLFKDLSIKKEDFNGDILRDMILSKCKEFTKSQLIDLERVIVAWDEWRFITAYINSNINQNT